MCIDDFDACEIYSEPLRFGILRVHRKLGSNVFRDEYGVREDNVARLCAFVHSVRSDIYVVSYVLR